MLYIHKNVQLILLECHFGWSQALYGCGTFLGGTIYATPFKLNSVNLCTPGQMRRFLQRIKFDLERSRQFSMRKCESNSKIVASSSLGRFKSICDPTECVLSSISLLFRGVWCHVISTDHNLPEGWCVCVHACVCVYVCVQAYVCVDCGSASAGRVSAI